MRRAMMVLAAVCVAGMAQAVTWSWAATNQTYGAANLDEGYQSTSNSTVTYAAVLHSGASITSATQRTILMQLGIKEGGVGVNLEVRGGNIYARSVNLTQGFDSNLGVLNTSKDNAFAIRFMRKEADITLNFYLNGVLALEKVVTSDKTFAKLSWGDSNDASGGPVSNDGTYSVAMTTDTITAGDITVANLPEPTALALLALGVAGLALRRRVA